MLTREYHGHVIESSDDMRRHEVFDASGKSIGVHETLGLAIAQTRGKTIPPDPESLLSEEHEEQLSIEEIVEGEN